MTNAKEYKINDFDRYIYEICLEYMLENPDNNLIENEKFMPWVNGMLCDYNIIWGCGLL